MDTMLFRNLFVVALVAHGNSALAEEFTGKVVGVSGGDTITVLRDRTPVKIRLQAVDCPEKTQPFGAKAKQFTSDMVFGKVVTVKVATRDRYGRTVAWVSFVGHVHRSPRDRSKPHRVVPVLRSLNEELLSEGLAWNYKQYDKSDKLAKLEQEARAAKRGLWADANPTPPWDWRRGRKEPGEVLPCSAGADCVVMGCGCRWAVLRKGARHPGYCQATWPCRNLPPPRPTPACVEGICVASESKAPAAAAASLRGNTKSKVFHSTSCKDYNCQHCTTTFVSVEEAVKQGYRPHNECVDKVKVAPQQPASKDRACKDDKDCTFEPVSPCACPPCGDTWRRAVNKNRAAFLGMAAVGSCGRGNCAKCNRRVRWLGEKSVCIKGQCTVR